jgi:hypothetical protein
MTLGKPVPRYHEGSPQDHPQVRAPNLWCTDQALASVLHGRLAMAARTSQEGRQKVHSVYPARYAGVSFTGLPLVAWTHRLKEDGDGRDTQEGFRA